MNLKYFLTLLIPEFPFSTVYEQLHTSEGREVPVSTEGGVQVFAGAEFRYNSGRNGKIDGLLTYTKPRRKQDVLSLSLTQTTSYFLRESIQGGMPVVDSSNDLAKNYAIEAGLSSHNDEPIQLGGLHAPISSTGMIRLSTGLSFSSKALAAGIPCG